MKYNHSMLLISIVASLVFDGQSVGIIANQPKVMAGCLDINASDKSSRFIRFCDAFNIPIVNFVDVPGFLPGTNQEWGGIIRHGAKCYMLTLKLQYQKLLSSLVKHMAVPTSLCVPKIQAQTKYMLGLHPKIAVMGPAGAANIIFKKDEDKDAKTAKYVEEFATPYKAAERGFVDVVIEPKQTRPAVINALAMLASKRENRAPKKHGNIPL